MTFKCNFLYTLLFFTPFLYGELYVELYNKKKHSRSCLKKLINNSYIVNRTVSKEELDDINSLTKFFCKTVKEVISLVLSFPSFLPSKTYILKDNTNKIIGFITILKCSYYEEDTYEICYFSLDDNIKKIDTYLFFMLDFVKTKALNEGIRTIRIDFQKTNASELAWIPYFKEFGFTFTKHSFSEDGLTCIYTI